jgi:threonyl-tRNA synthetase
MTSSLSDYRLLAAHLLTAALLELYPDVLLDRIGETAHGFYCDFVIPFALGEAELPLIEERMRKLAKEKLPIKTMEMVSKSAAALMQHCGQDLQAEALIEEEGLVSLIKIGEFVAPGSPLPFTFSDQGGAFALLSAQRLGDSTFRLLGAAYPNKPALKEFLKRLRDYPAYDHVQLAQELALTADEGAGFWSWLPRGEVLRQQLVAWWQEEHAKRAFQFLSTPRCNQEGISPYIEMAQMHAKKGKEASAELSFALLEVADDQLKGMLNPRGAFIDQAFLFCPGDQLFEKTISSLQFILKIPKLFGLKFQVVLCSKRGGILERALEQCKLPFTRIEGKSQRVEIQIEDALGCMWTGPSLNLHRESIVYSCFGSLERFVALLIEQKEGLLPFWLAPEQLRVFALGKENEQSAQELAGRLKAAGFRAQCDCSPDRLAKRMHDALRERIPYCIVTGDKEKSSRAVSVRSYGQTKEEAMSEDALLEKLLRELKQKVDLEN